MSPTPSPSLPQCCSHLVLKREEKQVLRWFCCSLVQEGAGSASSRHSTPLPQQISVLIFGMQCGVRGVLSLHCWTCTGVSASPAGNSLWRSRLRLGHIWMCHLHLLWTEGHQLGLALEKPAQNPGNSCSTSSPVPCPTSVVSMGRANLRTLLGYLWNSSLLMPKFAALGKSQP